MNYSALALDRAIGIIFPQYIVLKENSVDAPRVTWMKMVAGDYFLNHFTDSDRRNIYRMEAYHVVHQGLIELNQHGVMTFDDEDLIFF